METIADMQTKVMIDHVIKATCSVCKVNRGKLTGKGRMGAITLARQMAMTVCIKITGQSYPDIGRRFRRDRTTVINAIDVVTKLARDVPEVAKILSEIASRARRISGEPPVSVPLSALTEKPSAIEVPRRRAPAEQASPLKQHERDELRRLRAKGWSVGGLSRRYGISADEVLAELGEKHAALVA